MTEKQGRRVALVTGSRRGIGLGIALALAQEGFDLALNAVSSPEEAREALQKVAAEKIRAEYVQADISLAGDRSRLLREVRRLFGRLDCLVNNAGVAPEKREDILMATEESFDRLIRINLKGPYFLTQQAARWMIEQKQADPDRTPCIVTVSSISAYTASTSRGEYCVSKAGLSMMTALFAARLAEHGIGVYEVRPGIIATDMTGPVRERYNELIAAGLTPIRRWGRPDDIGRAVAAMARGDLPFSTGEVINVDGGFHLRTL